MGEKRSRLRLSPLGRVYRVGAAGKERFVLRHSLLNHTFVTDRRVAEAALARARATTREQAASAKGLRRALSRSRILRVPAGDDNELIESVRTDPCLTEPTISILYLSATSACNLGCSYCFVFDGMQARPPEIPPHELAKGVTAFLRNWLADDEHRDRLAQDVTIFVYGGEPFLAPDSLDLVLSQITPLLSASGRRVRVEAVTNGTTLTDAAIRVIRKHRIGLAVSLDGPSEEANRHRRFRGGRPAFPSVIEGVERLRREGIEFGVSCTITGENRSEISALLDWVGSELGVRSLGFNLLLQGGPNPPESDVEADNAALQDAFLLARSLGIYEDRIGRKAEAFNRHGHVYWKDCAARGHQLVFFSDGTVGVCQAYLDGGERFGPAHSTVPRDVLGSPLFKRWAALSPVTRSACVSCPALGICGGGCAFDAQRKNGELGAVPPDYCSHVLSTLEFLIKLAVVDSENSKGRDVRELVRGAEVTDVSAQYARGV